MMFGNQIRINRSEPFQNLAVYIAEGHMDGDFSVATNIIMEKGDPGKIVAPCMSLSEDGAQKLMDDLWNVGIRPTESDRSNGTEAHVRDLRYVVDNLFQLLKGEK